MSSERKIITVCLNPSLDRTVRVRYLSEGYNNRAAAATRLDPAGEGVSISRAIDALGGNTHAILLLGDDPVGQAFQTLIEQERFSQSIFVRPGPTRSDTIILDEGKHIETRLWDDCNEISSEAFSEIDGRLRDLIQADDWVVLAGTVPVNVSGEAYGRLLQTARDCEARSIVVTPGSEIDEVVGLQPDLLVLTHNQLEGYFNYPIRQLQDVASCARQLGQNGIGRVMIILEEAGQAVLSNQHNEYIFDLPDPESGTSSGIWEGFLAGFLLGRLKQKPLAEALEIGAAAAVYTANQIGNEFGSSSEIEQMRPEIDVSKLN